MIVLDVNAAVAIAHETEDGLALQKLMLRGEEIIAPNLFIIELGNVAWKLVSAKIITEKEAFTLINCASALVDRYIEVEDLLVESVHEAIRNNHPIYDLLYLVTARRNGATLFTLDKKLRKLCIANGVNCIDCLPLD